MKMRQLVRLMVPRTAAYAVGSIGGHAMRSVAILACFSGFLWGMPASAEELSVPADYQGRQMQLRADFEKPDWARDFDATSWAQFFLNYLLGNGAVTAVIPGTNKVEHMENSLALAGAACPTPRSVSR